MGSPTDESRWRRRLRTAIARRIGIDGRALAALRIGLGVLLLLDLGLRARSLRAMYTDAGLLPQAALLEHYGALGRVSVHALSGSAWFQASLFVLTGVAAIALLVGYRTTLSTVVCWLLLASLHARNPLVLNAGDSLFRRLHMWGIFLPLGARWSIDAASGADGRDRVVSVASAAILVQVVLVYVVNGVLKLRGSAWSSGDAVRIVFELDQLTVLFGETLSEYPTVLTLLDRAWLLLLFGAIGLLLTTGRRRAALVGAFALGHVGMLLTLRLGIFPLVSVVALVVFLPEPVWDRVESRIASRLRAHGAFSRIRDIVATRSAREPSSTRRRTANRYDGQSKFDRVRSILPGALLALMLVWNAAALGYVAFPVDDAPVNPREHRWDMFAPRPLDTDVWYVAPGTLASGDRVDALHGGPVDWDRPPDGGYPTARWRKALMDLWRPQYAGLRPSFAGYLCRRWNHRHDDDLESVRIAVVESSVRLDGPDPRRRVELWRGSCPEA